MKIFVCGGACGRVDNTNESEEEWRRMKKTSRFLFGMYVCVCVYMAGSLEGGRGRGEIDEDWD